MADRLSIDVDVSAVLRALDRLGAEAETVVRAAARETAQGIVTEARARLERQTHGTGQTARNLTVTEDERAVYVYVQPVRRPANLTLWLDQGTVHMEARPFFVSSAELEHGPHLRRVADGLERAVRAAGGG